MQITKKDVIWNFLATFLKTASSLVLLPIILKLLTTQDVGLWAIFVSIGSLVAILDFGFAPSFSRNITFIFSGVNKLSKEGYSSENVSEVINYTLLKSTLRAMKYFYFHVSIVIFLLLSIFGTLYIRYLLREYNGSDESIYIAWGLFVCFVSFNMYTNYYESLLIGKGLVKISKQITIISQVVYLTVAATLLFMGFGLVGLFGSQVISSLITRYLSYRSFYTPDIRQDLSNVVVEDFKGIIRTIFPNAVKGGITSLGSIFIYRAPLLIGSMFLSLKQIGSYGLTRQIFDIVFVVASTYSITYFPQFSNNWMKNKVQENRRLYVQSLMVCTSVYIIIILSLMLFGNVFLSVYGSKTLLLEGLPLTIIIVNYFFTLIHGQSVPVIISRNYLPMYYVGFIGGLVVMALTYILLKFFSLGILGLVIPPTVVYLAYENWKWPYLAFKTLGMDTKSFVQISKNVLSNFIQKIAKQISVSR